MLLIAACCFLSHRQDLGSLGHRRGRGLIVTSGLDAVRSLRLYLWLAGAGAAEEHDTPREVRFLAPFDPVVWDRRRFEHLWGWPYRFEAYTPAAKRRLGYYAMPLLWGERVIGWANASVTNGTVQVTPGFPDAAPKGRDFHAALDAEIARLTAFLQPR